MRAVSGTRPDCRNARRNLGATWRYDPLADKLVVQSGDRRGAGNPAACPAVAFGRRSAFGRACPPGTGALTADPAHQRIRSDRRNDIHVLLYNPGAAGRGCTINSDWQADFEYEGLRA